MTAPEQSAAEHAATAKRAVDGIRHNIGFALAEKNIPHEPTWTLLVPQALDNIDAALDALTALAERAEEAEARVRELEADPDRPTVVYAGDELEAAESSLEDARELLAMRDKEYILAMDRAEAAEKERDELWAEAEATEIRALALEAEVARLEAVIREALDIARGVA